MSEFENDEPINDPMVVLDLACRGWNDGTDRCISLWPHSAPHVEIKHFSGGYERYSGTDRYLVAQSAVDYLLSNHLLKGTPEWGYTNMRELLVSQRGEEVLWERIGVLRNMGIEFPRATRWLHRRNFG